MPFDPLGPLITLGKVTSGLKRLIIKLWGRTSVQTKAHIYLFLKRGCARKETDRERLTWWTCHTFYSQRESDNERLLIQWHTFPTSLVGFAAGNRITQTLLLSRVGRRRKPKRLCSATWLRVPLNSMTHFSQLGLAGRAHARCLE